MTQAIKTPDEVYGELFRDVQQSHVFEDSKTFVDCIPKRSPAGILQDYKTIKATPGLRFSLEGFIRSNFIIPSEDPSDYRSDEKDLLGHIQTLWSVLHRKSDGVVQGSSLLPLPFDYIMPGGRFREVYYWDSYFTMLGLKESGNYGLIENMIRNFDYFLHHYGHIPNGNRSYYLGRSQPPFFSLMVELLAGLKGEEVYVTYLSALEREYAYWMDRTDETKHVVSLPDGSLLNRYWDQYSIPRQEMHAEDIQVVPADPEQQVKIYKHIRSAAESGWDFSSRWLGDGKSLSTIQTTDLVPVDLNCLLHHLECTVAKGHRLAGNGQASAQYEKLASTRSEAIMKYCWDSRANWFVDYNIERESPSPELTLAGITPFFLGLATTSHMEKALPLLQGQFLKPGGVVTSLKRTGQQWDAPNGWAPLQWMTVIGLENYGQPELAATIAGRWVALNKQVFAATGKLVEKYDVEDAARPGGGGEYPSQDGFGWTNGVLLAFIKKYGLTD